MEIPFIKRKKADGKLGQHITWEIDHNSTSQLF